MEKNYCINDSLRIFDNGQNEIRFKLGLWNYNEAVLDLKNEKDEFKISLREILKKLRLGMEVSEKSVHDMDITDESKNNILNILNGLSLAGMLINDEQRKLSNEITMSLLGDYKYFIREDLVNSNGRKLLFISDNTFSNSMAKLLIEEMELNMDIASESVINAIRDVDLTTNIDAINIIENINAIQELIKDYEGIVLCLKRPELTMIRNVNRVAIKREIPVICSFIDGPFITAFSTNYPKTGCLECFEQRTLTRLEDHISYHAFENFKFSNETKDMNKGIIPVLNTITNLVVSEAFLLSNYGTSKFENRVLNIYVPTLEIQVQDLLRVPYCPACGNVSKAKFQELNVSSRTVVDNIIDSIR